MKLFFAVILSVFCNAAVQARQKVVLSADPWCPYTCGSKEHPGFMTEVVQSIFKTAGYEVDYTILSWTRALAETRKGSSHGVIGALKSDAPDFLFPKTALAQQRSCFFSLKNKKFYFKDEKSLKGHRLGGVQNYSYGEPLDSYIERAKKDESSVDLITGDETLKALISKLLMKRIDVFVEDQNVAHSFLADTSAQKEYAQIEERGCLKAAPLYVAFSPNLKESKEFVRIFDKGLVELEKNGQLKELLKKYKIK